MGSLDDEGCISPTDAHQWIYDRARGQASLEEFIAKNDDIQEEEEDPVYNSKDRRDSENFQIPTNLSDMEKSKLLSCIDEIRNIVGETYSDAKLTDVIIANNYDFNKALDKLLKGEPSPKSSFQKFKPPPPPVADTVEKGKNNQIIIK